MADSLPINNYNATSSIVFSPLTGATIERTNFNEAAQFFEHEAEIRDLEEQETTERVRVEIDGVLKDISRLLGADPRSSPGVAPARRAEHLVEVIHSRMDELNQLRRHAGDIHAEDDSDKESHPVKKPVERLVQGLELDRANDEDDYAILSTTNQDDHSLDMASFDTHSFTLPPSPPFSQPPTAAPAPAPAPAPTDALEAVASAVRAGLEAVASALALEIPPERCDEPGDAGALVFLNQSASILFELAGAVRASTDHAASTSEEAAHLLREARVQIGERDAEISLLRSRVSLLETEASAPNEQLTEALERADGNGKLAAEFERQRDAVHQALDATKQELAAAHAAATAAAAEAQAAAERENNLIRQIEHLKDEHAALEERVLSDAAVSAAAERATLDAEALRSVLTTQTAELEGLRASNTEQFSLLNKASQLVEVLRDRLDTAEQRATDAEAATESLTAELTRAVETTEAALQRANAASNEFPAATRPAFTRLARALGLTTTAFGDNFADRFVGGEQGECKLRTVTPQQVLGAARLAGVDAAALAAAQSEAADDCDVVRALEALASRAECLGIDESVAGHQAKVIDALRGQRDILVTDLARLEGSDRASCEFVAALHEGHSVETAARIAHFDLSPLRNLSPLPPHLASLGLVGLPALRAAVAWTRARVVFRYVLAAVRIRRMTEAARRARDPTNGQPFGGLHGVLMQGITPASPSAASRSSAQWPQRNTNNDR